MFYNFSAIFICQHPAESPSFAPTFFSTKIYVHAIYKSLQNDCDSRTKPKLHNTWMGMGEERDFLLFLFWTNLHLFDLNITSSWFVKTAGLNISFHISGMGDLYNYTNLRVVSPGIVCIPIYHSCFQKG